MTKNRRLQLTAIAMLVLLAIAGWLASPYSPRDLKLGLDLQGGAHLVYEADLSGIDESEQDDALAGVRDVIERRVNNFGVAEPLVQTNRTGDKLRIIVELAGIFDVNQAIELIGATPQLDFRREVVSEEAVQQFNIDDPNSITGPIFERTDLSGSNLKRATVSFGPTGDPAVNLEFDSQGTDLFAELTGDNIGKRIAIYLDGVPISAPVVQAEIKNGQAVISGGFTVEEAKSLAQSLNAGALPVPVELVSQQTVGPALGQKSIDRSWQAGLFGLALVAIWMIVYYRIPGVVATIALAMYVILMLAIIKLIPITMTLAGIAGLILSIGMAVDANVLIFERLRENIKTGSSKMYALAEGFKDAWSSIWTANISSLITAVILFLFGSSIIRGFALTFGLGVILSMFTAVTVTRTILSLIYAKES